MGSGPVENIAKYSLAFSVYRQRRARPPAVRGRRAHRFPSTYGLNVFEQGVSRSPRLRITCPFSSFIVTMAIPAFALTSTSPFQQ
jgi:hypothetical protein